MSAGTGPSTPTPIFQWRNAMFLEWFNKQTKRKSSGAGARHQVEIEEIAAILAQDERLAERIVEMVTIRCFNAIANAMRQSFCGKETWISSVTPVASGSDSHSAESSKEEPPKESLFDALRARYKAKSCRAANGPVAK